MDTNVIIEAFRARCWNALTAHFSVETVEKCYEEALTGDPLRPGYVSIDGEQLRRGLRGRHGVPAEVRAVLDAKLAHPDVLDAGERAKASRFRGQPAGRGAPGRLHERPSPPVRDRRSLDPIAFGAVDRGLFPDEAVRREFPVPEPSRIDDPGDPRRVRALVADLLEEASAQGHTVLPQGWVIRREVRGWKKGKPHAAAHDWRKLVDRGLAMPLPVDAEDKEIEERARAEKAAALEPKTPGSYTARNDASQRRRTAVAVVAWRP